MSFNKERFVASLIVAGIVAIVASRRSKPRETIVQRLDRIERLLLERVPVARLK